MILPDINLLAYAYNSDAPFHEPTRTGKTAFPALRHPDQITCVAFSPDDRFLITASREGGVRMWDLASAWSSPLLVRKQGRNTTMEFDESGS